MIKKKFVFIDIAELPIDYKYKLYIETDHLFFEKISNIWDRWLRGSTDVHITKENSKLDLVRIRAFFYKQNIKQAILYTTVPHHIDITILSYCLNFLKIPEYYIYEKILIGNVYLIIRGSLLFSKRQIKNEELCKYDPSQDIERFLSINNSQKSYHVTNRRWYQKSFLISLFISYLQIIKSFINKKEHKNISSNQNIYKTFNDMTSQKLFLNYYKKKCINNLKRQSFPRIIIVANYQPEASTIPVGGKFQSHIDLILKIRSLRYSKDIFYKEHPDSQMFIKPSIGNTGIGGYRSISYLDNLIALGVKLLPYNFPVIDNSNDWIITISGHIAVERSLKGLKTIIAGHPWFEGLPGNINIDKVTNHMLSNKPGDISIKLKNSSKVFLYKKLLNNCLPNLQDSHNEKDISKHIEFIEAISKLNG